MARRDQPTVGPNHTPLAVLVDDARAYKRYGSPRYIDPLQELKRNNSRYGMENYSMVDTLRLHSIV